MLRKEAEAMCKRLTVESIDTNDELEHIDDYRVTSVMEPDRPVNIFKACLAGIRRQRF